MEWGFHPSIRNADDMHNSFACPTKHAAVSDSCQARSVTERAIAYVCQLPFLQVRAPGLLSSGFTISLV